MYVDQPDENFTPDVDDGAFIINYANWRDIYTDIFVVYDFPDEYVAIRASS